MNKDLQEKVQAWVDGELDATEARRVAALLDDDREAAALAGNLRSFRQVLRDHEPAHPVPDSPEFYWSQIRRGIEHSEGRTRVDRDRETPHVLLAPRRWLAWLVPAAAVALIVFALRPGPVPSGPLATGAQASVSHDIEVPLGEVNMLTFYSASDAMTVVWVGRADIL